MDECGQLKGEDGLCLGEWHSEEGITEEAALESV